MVMARKQVLMQLDDDLVQRLDELGRQTGRNRSDLAREALADLLDRFSEAAIDRQYIEALQRTAPDPALERLAVATEGATARHLDEIDGGW
jgi:predicted transcriptional regulator